MGRTGHPQGRKQQQSENRIDQHRQHLSTLLNDLFNVRKKQAA